jgi:hypothetical protein
MIFQNISTSLYYKCIVTTYTNTGALIKNILNLLIIVKVKKASTLSMYYIKLIDVYIYIVNDNLYGETFV